MSLFYKDDLFVKLQNKYLFLDNDFLGEAFNSEEVADLLVDMSDHSHLIIDPFTEFEFLRDVFLKEQLELRLQFLNISTISIAINHPDIYKKILENALVLSKVYAHQGRTKGVSTVDLMLASRIMLYEDKSLLVTGNIKHFPLTIYNLIDVINITQNDGHVKVYGILQFNLDLFTQCYESVPT